MSLLDINIFRKVTEPNFGVGFRRLGGYVLGEEMLHAEEGIRLVYGSRPGLDAAIPGLEAPAADPALHLDAEVPVGAEAPLGKDNLFHFYRTRKLVPLRVIKGPFRSP